MCFHLEPSISLTLLGALEYEYYRAVSLLGKKPGHLYSHISQTLAVGCFCSGGHDSIGIALSRGSVLKKSPSVSY